jgi:hypothetical protein
MAVFSGPEIVNDGLVFYYDMDNQKKSWKGKPTTNLHTNTSTFSGWTLNAATIDTIDNVARLTETGTTSGPFMLQDSSLTNGVVYSESIDARADLRYVLQIAPSTGFSNNTLYTNFNLVNGTMTGTGTAKSTMTYLGDDWYRCTYTETASSTSAGRMVYGIAINPESTRLESAPRIDGYGIFVNQSQLEANSFATPFVVGTRSATQSLIEMTGNRSITINSITTPSDGKFNFSSSNSNYMTLSSSVDIYNKSYTVSSWIKRTALNSYHGIIGDLQFNWFQFMITSSNKLYLRYGYYDNGEKKAALAGSTNIGLDYTNVVATYELGVGIKLYVNGVLDGTATYPIGFGLTGGSRGPRYIGRSDNSSFGTTPYFFNGEINILQFHNRALTLQEIAQNFEAMRGRYGI